MTWWVCQVAAERVSGHDRPGHPTDRDSTPAQPAGPGLRTAGRVPVPLVIRDVSEFRRTGVASRLVSELDVPVECLAGRDVSRRAPRRRSATHLPRSAQPRRPGRSPRAAGVRRPHRPHPPTLLTQKLGLLHWWRVADLGIPFDRWRAELHRVARQGPRATLPDLPRPALEGRRRRCPRPAGVRGVGRLGRPPIRRPLIVCRPGCAPLSDNTPGHRPGRLPGRPPRPRQIDRVTPVQLPRSPGG